MEGRTTTVALRPRLFPSFVRMWTWSSGLSRHTERMVVAFADKHGGTTTWRGRKKNGGFPLISLFVKQGKFLQISSLKLHFISC